MSVRPEPESAPSRPLVAPPPVKGQFRLTDAQIRVLRIACEYCRDSAGKEVPEGLDPDAWSGMYSEYRNTLIALWAAGRNGGWVEDRHAESLYYGGLLYLARDLTKIPYFTVEDAMTLDRVLDWLRGIAAAS